MLLNCLSAYLHSFISKMHCEMDRSMCVNCVGLHVKLVCADSWQSCQEGVLKNRFRITTVLCWLDTCRIRSC